MRSTCTIGCTVDTGTTYRGHSDAAVVAVSVALEHTRLGAHQLARGIAVAQTAVTHLSYAGPDSDEPDAPPS